MHWPQLATDLAEGTCPSTVQDSSQVTPPMAERPTRHPHWLIALGCAASNPLAATGCHVNNPYQPTGPTQASHAASALNSRPSLEDMQTTMKTTIERVGQQISAAAPGVTFDWRRTASRAGCNPPYEHSDGKQILMPNYVSEVPIPEQHWKQSYDIARQAASDLGATNVTVFKDNPNDHDVQFTGDTGTTLRLGSQVATLITGGTGCRLPADKH